jgi:hypothetical protein
MMTIETTSERTSRVRRWRALSVLAPAVLAAAPAACGPVTVSGGPARTTLTLNPAALGAEMRPLVQDEPAAVERLAAVERNGSISRVFLWSGFAALGGCLLVSNSTINQPRVSSTSTGLIFGTCGLAIGLEIASVIFAPTYGDYGDVLRVYNARRPAAAWFSPGLGVDPPAGGFTGGLSLRAPRVMSAVE